MKKRSMRVRVLSCLSALLIFVGSGLSMAVPAAAATVNEQIKQLEAEQAKLKKQIASAKSDLADSKKTRDLYNSQISNVQKQIDLLDKQADDLNAQINSKNTAIADLEKQVAANEKEAATVRKMLGERLNAIMKRGNFSTLQLLMDTDNYADYLVRAKLMEKVSERDQQSIEDLEKRLAEITDTEKKVQSEKAAVEEKKKEVEALRASSTSKKKELSALYTAANAAYKQDAAEVAALNKELEKTDSDIKKLLASLNSSGSYVATSMYWPVPTVRALSSYFGTRWGRMHRGVDIANGSIPIYGQNVVAAADGTVIYSNYTSTWGGGYGYYCMVDHGRDSKGRQVVTLYAHCSAMYARVGQKVVGGKTVLAKAGNTGNVTGPHLHFEVRLNGTAVDPLKGYISVKGK